MVAPIRFTAAHRQQANHIMNFENTKIAILFIDIFTDIEHMLKNRKELYRQLGCTVCVSLTNEGNNKQFIYFHIKIKIQAITRQ